MSADIPEFDPAEVPLTGQSLIEASAGTGKTYNIVRLFARLLLEPDANGRVRRVSEILAVTFTRAATEELRERIRRLLEELLRVADAEPAPDAGAASGLDAFAEKIFARTGRAVARERLTRALADFDDAPIFTIHGFCRRALAEFAFEAQEAFEGEVVPSLPGMLREVAIDYWRRASYPTSSGAVAFFLEKKFTPEELVLLLLIAIGRTDARLPEVPERRELPDMAPYEAILRKTCSCWREHRDEVLLLLQQAVDQGVLNRGTYNHDSLLKLRSALDVLAALGPVFPGQLDPLLGKLIPSALSARTNKGQAVPEHELFVLIEQLFVEAESLVRELTEFLNFLTADLIQFGREEIPARADRQGVLTYDFLPSRLDHALRDPKRGPALRAGLRRRYSCALVDEFQDTDPVQWRIFRNIFGDPGTPLFLIGDPKQSIYGFRGADLDVYLAAAGESNYRHSLSVNHRSSRGLLAAFNVLFARRDPFRRQGIDYHPVRPPETAAIPDLIVDGVAQVPFEVRFPAAADGSPLTLYRGDAKDFIKRGTVTRIVDLLEASREGRALLGNRPVRPADIAVLVRTNREAEEMRSALEKAGVKSVLRVEKSLFKSAEAEELYQVLRAIENPSRSDYLRSALVTVLFGRTAADLLALEGDEAAFSELTVAFREYRELWMRHGFMHMFQELLAREHIAERILAYPEGERRMTNLLHLAEVLHREGRHRRGAELRALRGDDAVNVPEEHLIRLESDEAAVQVVTAHLSKGLQYGIVFVPFSWSIRPMTNEGTLCGNIPGHEGPVLLPRFLGGAAAEAVRSAMEEAGGIRTLEEELRLFYVAVTRARSHCTVMWGSIRGSLDTAPAYLFHNRTSAAPAYKKPAWTDSGIAGTQLLRDLTDLIEEAAGAITAEPLFAEQKESTLSVSDFAEAPALAERAAVRELETPFRIRSFTSLLHESDAEPEQPQHGEKASGFDLPEGPPARDAFGFPRGSRPGVFFHLVFERYFLGERDSVKTLVERTAAEFGLGDWSAVAQTMVEQTLDLWIPEQPGAEAVQSPQPQRVRLRDLPVSDCLTEVKFYYPDDSGYMTGFADLVFRAHGRYYLLDWKSNYLGATFADYSPNRLDEVMRAESYDLQYLIYVHALDRYLQLRDPDYSYEENFGGVLYIFLRGVRAGGGSESGVFFARPEEAVVRGFHVTDRGRKA